MNKYHAKKVWLDIKNNTLFLQRPLDALGLNIVCFDSQFEYRCYCVLRKYFRACDIGLHCKIEIKSKTLLSSEMSYKVDFVVFTQAPLLLYVEAKGLMTKEASLKLKMLEIVKPTIRNNLIIVSEKAHHYFGKGYPSSFSIIEFESYLQLRGGVINGECCG